MIIPREGESDSNPQLVRGIGLGSATALNMIDMIGVGPFITIPLIVTDGRSAGHAGMDSRRAAGCLRRAGVGRTRRGIAGVGRLLPLSERDLRAANLGSPRFVSLHLAIIV